MMRSWIQNALNPQAAGKGRILYTFPTATFYLRTVLGIVLITTYMLATILQGPYDSNSALPGTQLRRPGSACSHGVTLDKSLQTRYWSIYLVSKRSWTVAPISFHPTQVPEAFNPEVGSSRSPLLFI